MNFNLNHDIVDALEERIGHEVAITRNNPDLGILPASTRAKQIAPTTDTVLINARQRRQSEVVSD
jgi:hypothetical protein